MRHTNRHHIWFPRREYRTKVERKFRNLECNIVTLPVEIHNLLHMHSVPPEKPSVASMLKAIERHDTRRCGCGTGSSGVALPSS